MQALFFGFLSLQVLDIYFLYFLLNLKQRDSTFYKQIKIFDWKLKFSDFGFLISYYHNLLTNFILKKIYHDEYISQLGPKYWYFYFFLIIDLYFLIPAGITQMFNPIAELSLLTEITIKKVKAEMEANHRC